MLGFHEISVWQLVQILNFSAIYHHYCLPYFLPYWFRHGDTYSGIKSSGSLMDYKIKLYTSVLSFLFEGTYILGS